MFLVLFRPIRFREGFLYLIKKFFADYGGVFTFINLIVPLKISVVDRAFQYIIDSAIEKVALMYIPESLETLASITNGTITYMIDNFLGLLNKKKIGFGKIANDAKLRAQFELSAYILFTLEVFASKYQTPEREKRPFTIDFKPFVFFFVYVYTFFFTVIFINKGDLMEKTHLSLAYFNNFPNDYYILGGGLYQNGENHHFI